MFRAQDYVSKLSSKLSKALLVGGSLFLGVTLFQADAQAADITLTVVEPDGVTPVTGGFRWLVEEDTTHPVTPGVRDLTSLSFSFHKSHAPVIQSGETTGNATTITGLPDGTPFMVSVLPSPGYVVGGASVAAGVGEVTVIVAPTPLPTAQVSVKVFHDIAPLNNGPDTGEAGLEGFSVLLFDNAGQLTKDAFGNPVGTTYLQDASGNFLPGPVVDTLGSGELITDVNGEVFIKALTPNKYGVQVVPPAGTSWMQTTTIEGSHTIDVWVRPNELPFLVEFAPEAWHAFFGFVQEMALPAPGASQTVGTITGNAVKGHLISTPGLIFYPGPGVGNTASKCLVGLNTVGAGTKEAVFAGRCADDGSFTIPNVPPGLYELVVWDTFLGVIIDFSTVQVPETGGVVVINDLPVPMWFGEQEHYVVFDVDGNGFVDPEDTFGIPEQGVNLRFRDGTVYSSFPTDSEGYVPFEEVFPFFHWLVAEVDFTNFKATGARFVNDLGGAIPPGDLDAEGKRSPDVHEENGLVLTEAFQLMAGQNQRIDWLKSNYGPGENGGISGIVYYAVTRAEDEPRFAAGEEWESGIPRVQVNLYRDSNGDKLIDDIDGGGLQAPDIDNYPLGGIWPGPEDIDHNGNLEFDMGDAIDVTWSDSWDDSPPTGCIAPPFNIDGTIFNPPGGCHDGLNVFNQFRPGVFDGGYAFGGEVPHLADGFYIVEAVAPVGYEHLRSQHRNVDFGDEYVPSLLLLPAECVGEDYVVPAELTLYPGEPAPLAGQLLPHCDRKLVQVRSGAASGGNNIAADFFLLTEAPKAARVVGLITDDLQHEFVPGTPNFSEKFGPAFIPVSFRNYSDSEIARVYGDEFGAYNSLLPSSISVNIPTPSGVSPAMHTACVNHPGPIANPGFDPGFDDRALITDPHWNPSYATICYPFDAWPGKTTYLDTPVFRIAAFVGPLQTTVDCELPDMTPRIAQVTSSVADGPYVNGAGDSFTIVSRGVAEVSDPDGLGFPRIPRDYGFGSLKGTVTVGEVLIPEANVAWGDDSITVQVPAGLNTGQLMVTKADGTTTETGITLTVGLDGKTLRQVSAGQSIQDAIDIADPGDLILVGPGVYHENPVVYKKVRLQGAGTGATTIDALPFPPSATVAWREKLAELDDLGLLGLLEGQEAALQGQQGPGITVIPNPMLFGVNLNALIDGFEIRGARQGGGIYVNANAHFLQISNNLVTNNHGTFGGGINIGNSERASFFFRNLGVGTVSPSPNQSLRIHHNQIVKNGTSNIGGGVAIFKGANDYQVVSNNICGNFARHGGAGIGHRGPSNGGLIAENTIVFNESFQGDEVGGGGITRGGAGGIDIGGEPPVEDGALTEGSGSVVISGNLIQGNLAGASSGGGISVAFANGEDVVASFNNPDDWYRIDIVNNMIVDNAAGLAGGGIALQDVARANILHNTIARNDSSGTAALAFDPTDTLNITTPQVAGIAAMAHSSDLAFWSNQAFSNPALDSNIISQNRSFFWQATLGNISGELLPNPNGAHWDLGVIGTPGCLEPRFTILSDLSGQDGCTYGGLGNLSADPQFVMPYHNELMSAGAADEGGNFIQTTIFSPLTLEGSDYHVQNASPAVNAGLNVGVEDDFDGDLRPQDGQVDIGADENPGGIGGDGNTAPMAADDTAVTEKDVAVIIDVLGNDMDADGDILTVASVTPPTNGQASHNGTSATYTPVPGYVGPDSFAYTVSDGNGGTDTATVAVTVNDVSAEVITIEMALFKRDAGEWKITGNTSVPGPGNIMTAYLEPGHVLIGPAAVEDNGDWKIEVQNPNAFALPGNTVEVVSTGGATQTAPVVIEGATATELRITKAKFKQKNAKWSLKGKVVKPGPGNTVKAYLKRGNVLIGSAAADHEGKWELEVEGSRAFAVKGDKVKVVSTPGRTAEAPVEVVEMPAGLLKIGKAEFKWQPATWTLKGRSLVTGPGSRVTAINSRTKQVIGSSRVRMNGKWKIKIKGGHTYAIPGDTVIVKSRKGGRTAAPVKVVTPWLVEGRADGRR